MRQLISKIVRSIDSTYDKLRSTFAAIIIRLKYPSIQLVNGVYIGKRCKIISSNKGCIKLDGTHLSDGVTIIVSDNAKVEIGSSFIGMNCLIGARQSIKIGNNCAIAEFVVIRDQNHKHDLSTKLIEEQGFDSSPVIIEDNVWIGNKASVLQGVTIGKNSILGAHSLANKSIPKGSRYAGIPAKELKRNG